MSIQLFVKPKVDGTPRLSHVICSCGSSVQQLIASGPCSGANCICGICVCSLPFCDRLYWNSAPNAANFHSACVLQSNPGSVPPAPVLEAAMAKEDVTAKGRKREREPAGKAAAGKPLSPPGLRDVY